MRIVSGGAHPVVTRLRRVGLGPVRLSDVASRDDFHQGEIYELFFRDWGIEYVLAARVGHDHETHDFACYRRTSDFSDRDLSMLELLAGGRSNAEVAAKLVVAPGTVKKHLDNIYDKLGVHTRAAATARLHNRGNQSDTSLG